MDGIDMWRTIATFVVKLFSIIADIILSIVVFVVMTLAGLVLGIPWSLKIASSEYIEAMVLNLERKNPYRKTYLQPAIKVYYFDNVFREYKETVKSAFRNCNFYRNKRIAAIKSGIIYIKTNGTVFSGENWLWYCISGNDDCACSCGELWYWLVGITMVGFNASCWLMVTIFAKAFLGLLSGLHFLIMSIVVLFVHLPFGLLFCIDRVYKVIAHRKDVVETCPGCRRKHSDLHPGKYGLINRKCYCGEKIKTIFR